MLRRNNLYENNDFKLRKYPKKLENDQDITQNRSENTKNGSKTGLESLWIPKMSARSPTKGQECHQVSGRGSPNRKAKKKGAKKAPKMSPKMAPQKDNKKVN